MTAYPGYRSDAELVFVPAPKPRTTDKRCLFVWEPPQYPHHATTGVLLMLRKSMCPLLHPDSTNERCPFFLPLLHQPRHRSTDVLILVMLVRSPPASLHYLEALPIGARTASPTTLHEQGRTADGTVVFVPTPSPQHHCLALPNGPETAETSPPPDHRYTGATNVGFRAPLDPCTMHKR